MAFTHVQDAGNFTAGTSVDVTISPAAGNLVVMSMTYSSNTAGVTFTPSDNIDGNTGWNVGGIQTWNNRRSQMAWKIMPSGVTTITVTTSASVTVRAKVSEFDIGAADTVTLDDEDGKGGAGTSHVSGNTGVTSANEVLVITGTTATSGASYTEGSGYTANTDTAAGSNAFSQWQVFPSGCTNEQGAFTTAASEDCASRIIALSVSGGSSSVSVPIVTFTLEGLDPSVLGLVSVPLVEFDFEALAIGSSSGVAIPLVTFDFEPLSPVVESQIPLPLVEFTFESLAVSLDNGIAIPLVEFTFEALSPSILGQLDLPLVEFNFDPLSISVGTPTNVDVPLVEFNFTAATIFRGPVVALLALVNIYETWLEHFSNNSWDTIQDQIDAGYTYFALPALSSGSFEDVFDYGAIYENVIINVTYSKTVVTGAITDVVKIAVSDDNVTYTAFSTGSSYFAASVRYAKIRLEFTAADDLSLALYSELEASLSVKLETDSGTIEALAADAATGGTVVEFNKAFKDVNSITTTALSTAEPLTAFFNFVDAPNPTEFKVLVVDNSGNFVDATVDWKARGVI